MADVRWFAMALEFVDFAERFCWCGVASLKKSAGGCQSSAINLTIEPKTKETDWLCERMSIIKSS